MIFTILSTFHLSCQEMVYNKSDESNTLSFAKYLYSCKNTDNIKYSRWFGFGTLTLVTMMLLIHN